MLERLINRELLLQEASRRRLQVPDTAVAAVIQAAPAFAGENGFDRALYESQLRRQGLTPTAFENDLRSSLALQQLESGLADTAFMSAAELDAAGRTVVRAARPAPGDDRLAKIRAGTPPDDAAIQAYYDAHNTDFQTDEQVRVAYLELSLDAMASELAIDDAMLQKRYEELKPELGSAEQRRVRHILIRVAEDAPPAGRRAGPAKAADCARSSSPARLSQRWPRPSRPTPGSAEQGGDLGYFTAAA